MPAHVRPLAINTAKSSDSADALPPYSLILSLTRSTAQHVLLPLDVFQSKREEEEEDIKLIFGRLVTAPARCSIYNLKSSLSIATSTQQDRTHPGL